MILYIDIETYRSKDNLDLLTPKMKSLFIEKYVPNDCNDSDNYFKSNAALYPEFGKIICISIGYEGSDGSYHKISFTDKLNEINILNKFSEVLSKFPESVTLYLCGFNVKYFDIPFIIKRYMINELPLPELLKRLMFQSGSLEPIKPWESRIIDVMDLYKLGNTRATSLGVACNALNINCKTGDVTGVNMFLVPLEELDEKILTEYCEEDVYSTYLLHKKLINYFI